MVDQIICGSEKSNAMRFLCDLSGLAKKNPAISALKLLAISLMHEMLAVRQFISLFLPTADP